MDRKLVVLGIPWEIDTEGLREYMTKFGGLEDCIVMKERSSGRSRGFGYVTFVSAEDAKAVLSSEHFLGKRMLEVKVATPKEEMRAPSKKATRIFVARIPPSVTETTFRSHFEKYGEIIDLYMPKDHSSKAHRGIGFITYASADSVDNLMAETHELGGSTVVVDRATPKEDDFRPNGRMAPGGYGAYNAYISAATRYAALGAPTLYDHPGPFYGRGESSRGMGKKIFVGRLPQEASAEDLRQYFGRFGHILDVYVPKDPKRTGHRGFGFVTFAEDGVADRVSRRSHEICGHQVAIDSATPIDDAGPSGNFMMSGPEPFGSYAGPMRNFGRMYGTLDYDDASAYMVPSKWGYGMGRARPSRADWRNVARDLQDVACVPCRFELRKGILLVLIGILLVMIVDFFQLSLLVTHLEKTAVELGRIVDRGLRESRAVDTESLCVLAGKLVWAIRIDLHILDNGGNLVDAANIAALASLLTFRRPECTLGGEDGQEVIVHPPEEREPLPLIVHHLPIAITFAFFGGEGKMVVDPTQSEEAVMGGRMTVTVNANGDICAIQKPGGEGVPQSAIMHCMQLASLSAESITKKIKNAVEAYNTERALRKIKRHPTSGAGNVSVAALDVTEQNKTVEQVEGSELSRHHMERLKLVPDETCSGRGNDNDGDIKPSKQGGTGRGQGNAMNFLGGPSSWDPYSKVVDPDSLKASLASRGVSTRHVKQKGSEENSPRTDPEKPTEDIKQATLATDTSGTALQTNGEKTLKDAVKPKNKRRKRASPSMKGS